MGEGRMDEESMPDFDMKMALEARPDWCFLR